jgi:hypothetical protein
LHCIFHFVSFCPWYMCQWGGKAIGFIVDVFHHELKAIEKLHFKWGSSVMKFWLRLSATILSLMAKRLRTSYRKEANVIGLEAGLGDILCHLRNRSLQGSKSWQRASCIKSPQFRIFDWESTVQVAFWVKERKKGICHYRLESSFLAHPDLHYWRSGQSTLAQWPRPWPRWCSVPFFLFALSLQYNAYSRRWETGFFVFKSTW